LIVRAVGDIAINRDDPDAIFDHCAGALAGADLALAQLESVFTTAPPAEGRADAPLRSDPRNATALRRLGLDAISICGNHVMSCGAAGLAETRRVLDDLSIRGFGAGDDLAQAAAPLRVAKRGRRLAVIAANSILPPGCAAGPGSAGCRPLRVSTSYAMIEPNQPGTPARIETEANADDLAALTRQVSACRDAGERVIAWLHWGLHLRRATIADYQPVVAHALIDAGADAVIGTHPHVLKGVEVYRGRAIAYSLGNFAFDLDVLASPERRRYDRYLAALYPEIPDAPPADNRLYPFAEESRLTAMATIAFPEQGEARLSLRPAYIESGGKPRFASPGDGMFERIAAYLALVSRRFATGFRVAGDALVPYAKGEDP
jgi:poly-gamma-glutamate synthesis protein (capsule biosynthesis protein)